MTHGKGKVGLIPQTKEKYISFTKVFQNAGRPLNKDEVAVKFKFVDSFKFMNSSLDKLSSYLQDYPILRSQFPGYSDELFTLLCRKGVFPYSYVDCEEKLKENELPSIEKFDDLLCGKSISSEEYAHAKHVWESFGIKDLGEYSDLYLKTDVMLLAEVNHFYILCIFYLTLNYQ